MSEKITFKETRRRALQSLEDARNRPILLSEEDDILWTPKKENERLKLESKKLAERIKKLEKAIKDQLPTSLSPCPVCKLYGVTSKQDKCDKCRIEELENGLRKIRKNKEIIKESLKP